MEINEDTSKSSFNEASFKMKRLHELQEKCNVYREAPFKVSPRNDKPFFKLHLDALQSLYLEISSKLTDKEKSEIKPLLEKLRPMVKKLSLCYNEYGKIRSDRQCEARSLIDPIIELIFDAEELIRKLLDLHGFSTLNLEDDLGDAYN